MREGGAEENNILKWKWGSTTCSCVSHISRKTFNF